MSVILRKLNAAPRSRHELDRALADKNYSEYVRASALDRVSDMGYIDDQEFARSWVLSRTRSRGLAPAVLRRELLAKGVEREYIDDALAQIDADTSRTRAVELAQKKMKSLTSVSPDLATQRVYSLLLRKGYKSSEALEIAREVVGLDIDQSH